MSLSEKILIIYYLIKNIVFTTEYKSAHIMLLNDEQCEEAETSYKTEGQIKVSGYVKTYSFNNSLPKRLQNKMTLNMVAMERTRNGIIQQVNSLRNLFPTLTN